jgi:hypothetical protein
VVSAEVLDAVAVNVALENAAIVAPVAAVVVCGIVPAEETTSIYDKNILNA